METAGSIEISSISEEVIRIVDMKCPGSGMTDKNLYKNLDLVTDKDEVKFVIKDKADFEWAAELISKHELDKKTNILFSPVFGDMNEEQLAEWVLESGIQARFQVQLHKIIWGPDRTGV